MKLNSIGSVTPVSAEVSARLNSMPPTALRRSGAAAWYMARHAAGSPNIITGKNPAMKLPALGSPAKKRRKSPVVPCQSPTTNQATLLRTWCSPVTSSSRLSTPNANTPGAPALVAAKLSASIPPLIV